MDFPTFLRHTYLARVTSNWTRGKENSWGASHLCDLLEPLSSRKPEFAVIRHLARSFPFSQKHATSFENW